MLAVQKAVFRRPVLREHGRTAALGAAFGVTTAVAADRDGADGGDASAPDPRAAREQGRSPSRGSREEAVAAVALPSLSQSLKKLNPHLEAREAKRATNAQRGRTAKGRGTRFEDETEAFLRSHPRIAHITRCDARVHARGDEVTYREASGCDFVGLFVGGAPFVVECKSVTRRNGQVFASKAHATAQRKSRVPFVTAEQREQLDAYATHATAILYVRFGGLDAAFPWSAVRGHATIDTSTPGGITLALALGLR